MRLQIFQSLDTESRAGQTRMSLCRSQEEQNLISLGTLSFVVVIMAGVYSFAQDKPQIFQAVARGTGDQLGAVLWSRS